MMHAIHLRAETLIKQGRYEEAIKSLSAHLTQYSDDAFAKYLLAYSFLLTNKIKEGRPIAETLMAEDPEQNYVVRLLAEMDLAEDKYGDAETKANFLVTMDPGNADAYILLSRVKYLQRYYDVALKHIDRALELDADSDEALNLRIRITDMMGDYDEVKASLNELLNRNPENPTTLANLGMQQLNEGKVSEALETFSKALSLQPTNMLARHGMMEALKSRFFVYRLFFQYQKLMSKLSGKQAWLFIIGTYIGARVLGRIADQTNGTLQIIMNAVVIIIAITFFLSWVINPLMNLYLSMNKYGRLLLDEDDKKMGNLTGLSLLVSLTSLGLFLFFGLDWAFMAMLLFLGLMIPTGTYLMPQTEEKQKKLKFFGISIFIFGLLGIVFSKATGIFFLIAILGLLGYQFYFNRLMINSFSRKFE
jgi:tetratricopeptide (TPR) repeat protein